MQSLFYTNKQYIRLILHGNEMQVLLPLLLRSVRLRQPLKRMNFPCVARRPTPPPTAATILMILIVIQTTMLLTYHVLHYSLLCDAKKSCGCVQNCRNCTTRTICHHQRLKLSCSAMLWLRMVSVDVGCIRITKPLTGIQKIILIRQTSETQQCGCVTTSDTWKITRCLSAYLIVCQMFRWLWPHLQEKQSVFSALCDLDFLLLSLLAVGPDLPLLGVVQHSNA